MSGAPGATGAGHAHAAHVEVLPVTPERWDDLERLFGPSGAYSGCWCMWLRVTSREFGENGNAGNRRALRAIVDQDRVPGLLAYRDGEPVGWVSVAPREDYGRLDRSPVTKRVDDVPVWSIVCFFIARPHRRSGVASALLAAAVAYAAGHGAEVVEGYPLDPAERRVGDADAWHGTLAMFEAAGFTTVAQRRPGRPVVRRVASPEG